MRRWPSSARRGKDAAARRAPRRRATSTLYRELLEQFGPTEFTGREETSRQGRVLARACPVGRRRHRSRSCSTARRSTPSRAARSATPARSRTDTGTRRGASTPRTRCPGLRRHIGAHRATATIDEGRRGRAAIDGVRRDRIRRNHTAHARAALGAARGARLARAAGGLARRARPAALRLQPPRAGHARRSSRRSRTSRTRR